MEKINTMHAFTTAFNGLSNKLYNEAYIQANGKAFHTDRALWDTGATGTCVSQKVIKELGLTPIGYMEIKTPSGESTVPRYLVDIVLRNDVRVTDLPVMGTEIGRQGIDVLIGMDIICMGDLSVSNYQGKTHFTFRIPSKENADFVKQIRIDNLVGTKHGKGKRKKK